MNLKYSLRAFFAYEQIAGKPYEASTLNNTILFYCFRITSDSTYTKTFDEFVDELDADPKLFPEFLTWLGKEIERRSIFSQDEDEGDKKKD